MKIFQTTATIYQLGAALLLSACTALPLPPAPESTPAAVAEKSPEAVVKPFSEESLYELLVADIALTRGEFQLASEKYLQQAQITQDAGVVEMANRIAHHQRDADLVLQTALLWLDVAPNSTDAHRAVLQAYALHNDPMAALPHAFWLYTNNDDIETFLAVTAISEGKKNALIPALIEAYRSLPLSSDKKPAVELASAILYREMGQLEQSVSTAKQFLAVWPDDQRGLLLLAQTLHQQNNLAEATQVVADALKRQPENKSLRLQYARFLTLTDRAKAISEFEVLYQDDPQDQEVGFLLGLLYLNQGNAARAQQLFQQATHNPTLRADAYYHLGAIAEKNGDVSGALSYYQQVRFGRNYLTAATRSALLLSQQQGLDEARGYLQQLRLEHPSQSAALFQIEANLLLSAKQTDAAMAILSSGLEAHPNNSQLLYARSMVAELQNNFALAEQDLRALLAMDADNTTALNALGYTMLLHTDRYEEAQKLIQRAYLLNPGDPAIMDSLGWALFLRGDAQQALPHLEKAMAMMPDPEIAAHLGEVYWFLGSRDDAMKAWQRGLGQVPNHKNILETMRRLKVEQQNEEVGQ